MNLDEKLKEIVEYAQGFIDDDEIGHEERDRAVEKVKQAFADDGWIKGKSLVYETHIDDIVVGPLKQVMTGQEWYGRFIKEFGDTDWEVDRNIPIVAAKKAAGIDD